jgi:hypothetical protein
MKRLQRAVLLAELAEKIRRHGSWCGETHIQKAVYFVQELVMVPTGYGFILYKHGPFSFDLRDEITEFRAYELFRLEPRRVPYGPTLRPTSNAEELKKRFPNTLNKFSTRIAFVAEALDGKSVAELERLATALYVTREMGTEDAKDRAQKIHSLKPHVSFDLALNSVREVDEMERQVEKLFPDPA